MKTLLRIVLPLVVLAASAGILRWQAATAPTPENAAPPRSRPLVEVMTAVSQVRQLQVRTQGTVQALDVLPLAPEIGGRVIEIAPELTEGGYCRAGQVLFRLDPVDVQLALATADARLQQAEAALQLEQAAAAVAIQDWREVRDGDPPALVRREPQLATARAERDAARAARDREIRNEERTVVRAPFDARVETRDLALGQILSPGVPVARLLPTAQAEVLLPLALEELAFVDLDLAGQDAALEVELMAVVGGREIRRSAQVVRALPALDPASRMLRAVARIEDPFALRLDAAPLSPGLFVQATIQGRTVAGVFAVPRDALRERSAVYLADADQRLRRREVHVLQWTPEEALIDSGLEAGDRVILTALPVVAEGMAIEVREVGR